MRETQKISDSGRYGGDICGIDLRKERSERQKKKRTAAPEKTAGREKDQTGTAAEKNRHRSVFCGELRNGWRMWCFRPTSIVSHAAGRFCPVKCNRCAATVCRRYTGQTESYAASAENRWKTGIPGISAGSVSTGNAVSTEASHAYSTGQRSGEFSGISNTGEKAGWRESWRK